MFDNVITSFTGDFRFLSNFYPVDIQYEGFLYPSTEHAYQASKTLDLSVRNKLIKFPLSEIDGFTKEQKSAAFAKKLGATIPIRPDWKRIKNKVMMEVNWIKYQHPSLKERLLSTGKAIIIEGNTWGDTYWGQCPIGKGHNVLGNILMHIRSELIKDQKHPERKDFIPTQENVNRLEQLEDVSNYIGDLKELADG